MRDPIYSLRKNASLKNVAVATRESANLHWNRARVLREAWKKSRPSEWSWRKENYDKAVERACELSRLADHLERHVA